MKRILHISDLHFSTDYFRRKTVYSPLMNQMNSPFRQLERLLGDSEHDFDIVLCSGDICEYGTVGEYATVKKYLDDYFGCPVLVTAGNHDNMVNLTEAFGLNSRDGELFEVHSIDDVRVICLNSGHPDFNDGFISEKSCELLKEELKEEIKKTMVMTHHHLIPQQFSLPQAQYPECLREIVRESQIMAIVTGHTHHPFRTVFEGKNYFTAGSLSFVIDETEASQLLFYEEPSVLIYEVEDENIHCKKLSLGRQRNIGYL